MECRSPSFFSFYSFGSVLLAEGGLPEIDKDLVPAVDRRGRRDRRAPTGSLLPQLLVEKAMRCLEAPIERLIAAGSCAQARESQSCYPA